MIHNSEDKYVSFTLTKSVLPYDPHSTYSQGDVVWFSNKYWEYILATQSQGIPPTETATEWSVLTSAPVYDTTNIDGMVIVLYYKGSRNIIAKYSLNASVGYSNIDATNASSGKYIIELPSSVTTNKKEGILLAEIKIREVIAGYTGGDFNTIISDIVVSEINTPISEYISVP